MQIRVNLSSFLFWFLFYCYWVYSLLHYIIYIDCCPLQLIDILLLIITTAITNPYMLYYYDL